VKKLRVKPSAKKSKLPTAVYVTTAVGFFVAVGYGLIVPAIPLFAKSFGVTNTAIGLIVSTFAFARFSTGFIVGKIIERFGERLTLGIGLFFVAISSFAAGLAQSYWQLLIYRSLGGIGSMCFSVSANAILMRVVTSELRGRAQATYNSGFLIGGMAGPAFGGILTAISLRIPFFVYSGTLIIAGSLGLIYLSEKNLIHRHNDPVKTEAIKFRDAIKLFQYQSALVFAFLTNWVIFGLRNSILPLFVRDQLHSNAAVVGYGFTVSAILQGISLTFVGRLSDSKGRKFLLYVGYVTLIIADLVLAAASSSAYFYLSMAIFGVGAAFMGTGHANIVGDLFAGRAPKAIASWQMAGDAGMIIGPIVLGALADLRSYRTAFLASCAFFSISIFFIIKMKETRVSSGLSK
jgi:MFS family permease